MRKQGTYISALGFAAALICALPARANPPARTKLMHTFNNPIYVTFAPGDADHVLVCERAGAIRVMDTTTGAVTPEPFLDITPLVNLDSDNGLLALAFDPDYTTNGFFFINYRSVDGNMVLARYHAAPGSLVADADSAYTILRYPRPLGHNGGWIGFSPINGYLYITSGDGDLGGTYDAANRAQTISGQFMGKILRIDPRSDDFPNDPDRNYHIPATNPFASGGGDPEIWAYGVRNPWRASFDRLTGDFWFGDVGMNDWEEVNFEPAESPGGRNYGWPCMEGTHCTVQSTFCACNSPALTLPVFDYPHPLGNCVTGGYVYRGAAIPAFQGLYLFGDFLRSEIWTFRPLPGGGMADLQDHSAELIPPGTTALIPWIATFGEDAAGELYVCNIFGGAVYKIVPYPCLPEIDTNPVGQSKPVGSTITLTAAGAGADPLTFRWRKGEMELDDDDNHIQGALTATLTITGAQASDSGSYDVVLTSPCGSTDSPDVQVNVYVCSADFDGSGSVTVGDIFAFLSAWFTGNLSADIDRSGTLTVSDIFLFLAEWFHGC